MAATAYLMTSVRSLIAPHNNAWEIYAPEIMFNSKYLTNEARYIRVTLLRKFVLVSRRMLQEPLCPNSYYFLRFNNNQDSVDLT